MTHPLRDRTAIAGIGATRFYRRGESGAHTTIEFAGQAILAALEDAGLTPLDVDGFANYSGYNDFGLLAQLLGVPDVRYTASLTGGGGGASGCIGLAASAIVAGLASVVVSVAALQQPGNARFGAGQGKDYSAPHTSNRPFTTNAGLMSAGQAWALLARRHMHRYGTRREHFAEIAVSTRENATRRETALMRSPMTLEDYFAAPMIADPLCRFDYCLESEGAVAVVTVSAERARTLRQTPVYVRASEHGGAGRWGLANMWLNMPDELFTTAGHGPVAARLYRAAGLGPADIDVALIYDHFTPMVLMSLEDYGFCRAGESGEYVSAGSIRYPDGVLPLNTHGGNLSEAYILGLTHVKEAVEQLRGTAVNQVAGATNALVTGGAAPIPVSGLILGR